MRRSLGAFCARWGETCSLTLYLSCFRVVRRGVARQNLVHPQDERHGDRLDSDGSDKMLVMIVFLRHLLGWVVSACRSREDLVLENLALRQQLLASSARKKASPSIDCPAQAVLGRIEDNLVRVDEASRLGHSENRRELASGWISFVLDMGLKSQTSGRA